jgi:hypothetical protein
MAATELARERLNVLLTQLDDLKALLSKRQDELLETLRRQLQEKTYWPSPVKGDRDRNQDDYLLSRMSAVFEYEIGELRKKIEWDLAFIKGGLVKKGTWTSIEDRARECKKLFSEALSYLQAMSGLFGETTTKLCRIADAMLDQVNEHCDLGWRRFAVPADGESYSEVIQLIRLRFPLGGIWDIPVAAHEFGHFAAYRLRTVRSDGIPSPVFHDYFDGYLQQNGFVPPLTEVWRSYLNEFFADIFATYVLGPSYACSAVLLRFEPAHPHRDGNTHPSYVKRARAIIGTLQRMDMEPETTGRLSTIIEEIDNGWRDALASADTTDALSEMDQQQVDGIASAIYTDLQLACGRARYVGWQRAVALYAIWKDKSRVTEPPAIADLLNAAWLARLNFPSQVAAIGKEMISLL